jgi:hypothetical protein
VALVRTDVSEEHIASIIRVKRISELGTTLVTANIVHSSLIHYSLMMQVKHTSEMLILTRATWRHIQEDSILHSHGHENLKFYMFFNYNFVNECK